MVVAGTVVLSDRHITKLRVWRKQSASLNTRGVPGAPVRNKGSKRVRYVRAEILAHPNGLPRHTVIEGRQQGRGICGSQVDEAWTAGIRADALTRNVIQFAIDREVATARVN